jgi:ferredoxin
MGILDILTHNFANRSRTRKPKDTVPYPQGFRGALSHQLDLCTACGTCSYVCSPGAIAQDKEDAGINWRYDAGRCTYCGRCVEYCPTHALTFENNASPLAHQRAEQQTLHFVEYQHCAQCGAPIIPIPAETRLALYHSAESAGQTAEMYRYCERCRSKIMSRRMKDVFLTQKNK